MYRTSGIKEVFAGWFTEQNGRVFRVVQTVIYYYSISRCTSTTTLQVVPSMPLVQKEAKEKKKGRRKDIYREKSLKKYPGHSLFGIDGRHSGDGVQTVLFSGSTPESR